ncbi:hypothetical protein BAE36_02675 [Rhizobium leguminosarum bv. trifolii]|nr:hypothetical protein BAE36_02675 [Rhizobium leguminosarum bv. trifolii]
MGPLLLKGFELPPLSSKANFFWRLIDTAQASRSLNYENISIERRFGRQRCTIAMTGAAMLLEDASR